MTTVSNEIVKLLASDGEENNRFGAAVTIGDDVAIATDLCGNAYVFKTTDGGATWTETQKFTTTNNSNIRFSSCNISGNLAILSKESGDGQGAYIFKTTDGGSTWTQKKKIHLFN